MPLAQLLKIWMGHTLLTSRHKWFFARSAVAMLGGGGAGAAAALECPLCASTFDRALDVVELAPGSEEVRQVCLFFGEVLLAADVLAARCRALHAWGDCHIHPWHA